MGPMMYWGIDFDIEHNVNGIEETKGNASQGGILNEEFSLAHKMFIIRAHI